MSCRTVRTGLLFLTALAVTVTSAQAHHSFPAFYDESQSMSIEGELVAFEYRTPHAWVHIRVRDNDGREQTWSAEWASATRLARQNITQDTLKAGDHVIVTGAPGRNPSEHHLHLKRIERPSDGWAWAGGGFNRR